MAEFFVNTVVFFFRFYQKRLWVWVLLSFSFFAASLDLLVYDKDDTNNWGVPVWSNRTYTKASSFHSVVCCKLHTTLTHPTTTQGSCPRQMMQKYYIKLRQWRYIWEQITKQTLRGMQNVMRSLRCMERSWLQKFPLECSHAEYMVNYSDQCQKRGQDQDYTSLHLMSCFTIFLMPAQQSL